MKTGLVVLAAVLLAQTAFGQTASPPVAGLPGCNHPCTCKWRVTKSNGASGVAFNEGTGATTSPSYWRRTQDCKQAKPSLSMRGHEHGWGSITIPARTSKGSVQWHIEHIDMCPDCQQNAVMAGWSQLWFAFTGKTSGNAAYFSTTQMQAIFNRLTGANNSLTVTESGSSAGYGVSLSLSFGVRIGQRGIGPSASASGTITFPSSQANPPTNRFHISPWKMDTGHVTEEVVTLRGVEHSSGNANGGDLHAFVKDAHYNVGVTFFCKCNPGSHTPSPPTGHVPGIGTTPGVGGTTPTLGGGGTTPSPGGGEPTSGGHQ